MKKLNLLLAVAGLTLLWSCSKDNGKEEEPQQKPVNVTCVKVNGPDLIQPDGSKLYIKGVNIGNWLNQEGYMFNFEKVNSHQINEMFCQLVGPDYTAQFWQDFRDNYFTLEDMRFIKSTGANTIRLPISYKMFTNDDWMGTNDPAVGWKVLDDVISWCKETGVYLILGMHVTPGGNNGDNIDDSYGYPWLYTDEAYQDKLCKIWQEIAERCKTEAIVLAYDIIEEALPAKYAYLKDRHQPLLKKVTAAVREIDKKHIVIWGGVNYNEDFSCFDINTLGFDINDPTFADNIVFSMHAFSGLQVQDYVDFRAKVNRPLYVGGFGHFVELAHYTEYVDRLRENNIGWNSWPYKLLGSWSSFVGMKVPENWDKIVEFEKSPRVNYDDIIAARNKCGQDVARKAMAEFIENSKFKNCEQLDWYLNAIKIKD